MKRKFSFPRKEPRFAPWLFSLSWEQRKLGELCQKTTGGGTPSTGVAEYWNGEIPWFQSSDFKEGFVSISSSNKRISQAGLQKSAAQLIPEQSIAIVARVGFGKLALIPFQYTTSQDVLSLSYLTVDPVYAVYSVYKKLQSELMAVQGTSIKGVTKDDLLTKDLNLSANREEQEKIGALFSNVDRLITLHQRGANSWVRVRFRRSCSTTIFWEQRKLGELCDVFRSGEFIKASDIYVDGAFPVYGGNGLRGHADRFNYDGNYALIGRQGALCGNMNFSSGKAYFTEHAVAVHANDNNNTRFLFYLLDTMNLGQYSAQSAQPGLAVNKLITLPALCPSKLEQETIAEFLTRIDRLITLHQCKLRMLSKLRKMQILHENALLRRRQTTAWEQRKVGDLIEDYVERTTVQNQYPVLTSSQQQGIVLQESYFADRQVTTNDNVGYFVLPRGYFTYRSRSDTDVFVFNRNDIQDKGIISYYYPVFQPKNTDSDFLLRRLNHGIRPQLAMAAEGTGQKVLAHGKFKSMTVSVPKFAEQAEIGAFFRNLDDLITLHQREFTHTNPNTNYVKYYQRNRPLLCVLRSMDKSV